MVVPSVCYLLAILMASVWLKVYKIHPPYLPALLVSALVLLILFDFLCTFNPFKRDK